MLTFFNQNEDYFDDTLGDDEYDYEGDVYAYFDGEYLDRSSLPPPATTATTTTTTTTPAPTTTALPYVPEEEHRAPQLPSVPVRTSRINRGPIDDEVIKLSCTNFFYNFAARVFFPRVKISE